MTTFIRTIEMPVDDKPRALLDVVEAVASGQSESVQHLLFERETADFAPIPGTPFPYWANPSLLGAFRKHRPFASEGRITRQGLATANDFRFLRNWWEVQGSLDWPSFAKGGLFSSFYYDLDLVLHWTRGAEDAAELKASVEMTPNTTHWSRRIPCVDLYFRSGLTWPLRSQRGLSVRALPAGCVFGQKGSAAFIDRDDPSDTLACLAVVNSRVFQALVAMHMAFGAYDVGVIARTPVPTASPETKARLARLARRAWSLKRTLDTAKETSHAFLLPPGLNEAVMAINGAAVERELAEIQAQIDDLTFSLYGFSPEDRAAIEAPTKLATSDSEDAESSEDDDEAGDEAAVGGGSETLGSWLVGVTFGRFDPRLATDERSIAPEPEPFDPLPSRSPGMYPEGEEPADRPDILVDDEGRADDLPARAIAIAERVKVEPRENLRAWLAKEFFPLHIKMYSKSRRKAPLFWQLATPSASYSVWLYIHAFSKDTLFRVQNDYAAPKLLHEERRLESLTSELRDGATAAQRKTLAAQGAVVDELRAFLDEVKRVAPLWKPDLDDGVIINFAPLWRLVPHVKSWQKELKSTWDALCEGKYDWAHLAMHLWPERVVPKCAEDRSLAIAHGLEGVFWAEGTDGKWTARKTPTRSVSELVRERTSPAVKAALKSLLEAPLASSTNTGRRGGRRRRAAAGPEGVNA